MADTATRCATPAGPRPYTEEWWRQAQAISTAVADDQRMESDGGAELMRRAVELLRGVVWDLDSPVARSGRLLGAAAEKLAAEGSGDAAAAAAAGRGELAAALEGLGRLLASLWESAPSDGGAMTFHGTGGP